MPSLPYVTAPGNVERALAAIKTAATPPSVSQDFVKTILKIPGSSGNQMTSFLKKIGFANADSAPTDLYKSFRNPTTEGSAAVEALRIGYKPLYARNEYAHQLDDKQLKGLVIEETGEGDDSNLVPLIVSCIKAIKKFAKASENTSQDKSSALVPPKERPADQEQPHRAPPGGSQVRMNLGYTINLNLPATSDVAVFNAIFRSLRDHLLKGDHD